MQFFTRAIHVGQEPDPTTGATIPPVSFSTTYTQAAPGEHKGYEYSRTQNPTRGNLEAVIASLEGGEVAAAFSSGLAATNTILQTLRPGDGVVAGHDLYGGTFRLLDKLFRPWGLEVVFARDGSPEAFAEAIKSLKKPRLLWLETPTNPMLDLCDIAALAKLAKGAGMKTVVDNTFATPALQQPLALGADLIMHSSTKYLGGHSDVVGGIVVGKTVADLADIRFLQNAAGAVPGPLDCYLTHRGIKTLAVRMRQHNENALALAKALQGARGLKRVIYPGLADHPAHEIARRQMCGFGGMVSIEIDGGFAETKRFCSALRIFALAESLGGVESLCCHPATMTHGSIPKEIREPRGVTDSLVRLSVGIEAVEDLIADVRQALDALARQ